MFPIKLLVWTAAIILFQGIIQVFCDLACPSKFGYFPDPTDCAGYFICTFGNAKTRKCGNGLQYKTTTQTCDVPKPDNCQQDEGQANRPKYTGPTMQSSDQQQAAAAATLPAATGPADDTATAAPPNTATSFPFESVQTTQKQNYRPVADYAAASKQQSDTYGPSKQADTYSAGRQSDSTKQTDTYGSGRQSDTYGTTRRASLLDQYLNKATSKSATTKRNYDFWRDSTTTAAPPALKRPAQSNKPFRDNDYIASKARATSAAPIQYRPKLTTTQTPLDAYPDTASNDGQQQSPTSNTYAPALNSPGQAGPQQGSFGTRPDLGSRPSVPNFQFPQQSQGLAGVDDSSVAAGQDQQLSWNQNGNTWPDQGYQNAASQSQGVQPDSVAPVSVRKSVGSGVAGRDKSQLPLKSNRQQFPRPSVLIPTDSGMSQCTAAKCQLPSCYCGSTNVPGGLSLAETPQMIILSFDAEINERNLPIYERLFHKSRKNPNGCNIKGTFFVSHEFTNYGMVRYLYEKGHEIASHSITHGVGTGFKDEKSWETEMSGEKSFLASFASIRPDDIKGARAPLLGPGGDDQFQALLNGGFLYDSTLVTPTSSKAPFWPYTLDFAMPHTCVAPPCPARGYKGLWELPLNPIYGLFGENCYEADRCTFGSTGDDVYKLLYSNFFDRHYSTNKAPFHLAIHADWLKYPPHREAYERFLDVAGTMPDVWVVTGSQAVAWMQQPTAVSQLTNFSPWLCSADDASRLPQCDTINACPLPFRDRLRYFYTCSECPAEFPWRPEQ